MHQLGDDERALKRSIENVTEAELSRVFAAIHLEQISSPHVTDGEANLVRRRY
jgi:hypothetical protein